MSVLELDSGYTVKYRPLPEGVPSGFAPRNSFRQMGIFDRIWIHYSAVELCATLGGVSRLYWVNWRQPRGAITGTSYWGGTALHCTALHCTALHCTALHCTALHCTALHCTALHCTVLHWIVLHWLHCNAMHFTAVYCTVLHCTELHCTALSWTVVQCAFLKLSKVKLSAVECKSSDLILEITANPKEPPKVN